MSHINIPSQQVSNLKDISFENHYIEQFYRYFNLPNGQSKCVNIGYTMAFDNPKFIIWFMDHYVDWIDAKLDQLQRGTDQYADLFGLRGFKFSEFKLLLNANIGEEYFHSNRIFEYVFVNDLAQKAYFSAVHNDDENELQDNYLKAIRSAIELEIEPLWFFFERKIPVYIPLRALKRSAYLLAQSGSGKTELLKIMLYDLIRRSQKFRNRSVIVLEPHGDFSQEVLSFSLHKDEHRSRLVYLDPYLRETVTELLGYDLLKEDYTFSINPFDLFGIYSDRAINFLTQELSSAFFEVLKNESTTQMDALIEACVETLLRNKNTNIADLKSFMDDDENEALLQLMEKIPNSERRKMAKNIRTEKKLIGTKSGIYYRLQSLIGDSEFRRLLIHPSTINLEKEMNKGKIIIFNFNKAKMGKTSSTVFGKLILALIQGYAMKRQELPKEKRKETFCVIDECHNYITKAIRGILTEERKMALHLVLSHQVAAQEMETESKRAILGNTVLKIAGDNEHDSLKIMSENMGSLTPKDFEKLPLYSFYTYDKENKKRGSLLVRVPDFLVKKEPPFYMNKSELKELFLWLANESGYYRKVSDLKPINGTNTTIVTQEMNTHSEEDDRPPTQPKEPPKKDTDDSIYDPNFED